MGFILARPSILYRSMAALFAGELFSPLQDTPAFKPSSQQALRPKLGSPKRSKDKRVRRQDAGSGWAVGMML